MREITFSFRRNPFPLVFVSLRNTKHKGKTSTHQTKCTIHGPFEQKFIPEDLHKGDNKKVTVHTHKKANVSVLAGLSSVLKNLIVFEFENDCIS